MSRYKDMTDKPHNCEDCIHNDKQWYELPCDACCTAHSGFEPREKKMSRYIDADAIQYDEDIPDIYTVSKTRIDNTPSADVRKNVHAKKVIGGGECDGATCWFECSHCHGSVDIEDAYCKHCGAVLEYEP